MTAVLYIILGLSIGIGITLIYLQERYNRERRLLVSMAESERLKSSQTVKDLDEQWSHERDQYRTELQENTSHIQEMEHALSEAAANSGILPNQFSLTERTELNSLRKLLKERDDDKTLLEAGKNSLQKSLASQQQVINEMQEENSILKEQLGHISDDSPESQGNEAPENQLELHALKQEISRLKDALDRSEYEKEAALSSHNQEDGSHENDHLQQEVTLLKQEVQQLENDKNDAINQLAQSSFQQENSNLQQELTYLQGEILKLREENKKIAAAADDDDFLVFPQGGGHLLPGSVARALMKK